MSLAGAAACIERAFICDRYRQAGAVGQRWFAHGPSTVFIASACTHWWIFMDAVDDQAPTVHVQTPSLTFSGVLTTPFTRQVPLRLLQISTGQQDHHAEEGTSGAHGINSFEVSVERNL